MDEVRRLIVASKNLVDAISFDENGVMIGGQWKGGNGGLISRETNIQIDEVRRAIAAMEASLEVLDADPVRS